MHVDAGRIHRQIDACVLRMSGIVRQLSLEVLELAVTPELEQHLRSGNGESDRTRPLIHGGDRGGRFYFSSGGLERHAKRQDSQHKRQQKQSYQGHSQKSLLSAGGIETAEGGGLLTRARNGW